MGIVQQFLAYGTAITSTDNYLGTLDNGYFLTHTGPSKKTINLRSVNDPDTAIDTLVYAVDHYIPTGSDASGVQGSYGDPYQLRGALGAAKVVYQLTRSGSSIVSTAIGTAGTYDYEQWYCTPDGAQIGLQRPFSGGSLYLDVYNASPFALAYSVDVAALDTVMGLPATDRFVTVGSSNVKLYNDAGTLLDTETNIISTSGDRWLPSASDGLDVVQIATTGGTATYNHLSSAGDVLAWSSNPSPTFVPGWGTTTVNVAIGGWGGIVAAAPRTSTSIPATASVYWLNPSDGIAEAGQALDIGYNRCVGMAGAYATYVESATTARSDTTWGRARPTGPRRRAIGTSYHLRQRQTPYIR